MNKNIEKQEQINKEMDKYLQMELSKLINSLNEKDRYRIDEIAKNHSNSVLSKYYQLKSTDALGNSSVDEKLGEKVLNLITKRLNHYFYKPMEKKEIIQKITKKSPKKLPVAIDENEFMKLIENTKKDEHKLAFLLGWGAGLRISEIINLEQRDVNMKEKKIFIRQGKGGKDRIVPLPKGFKEKHLKMLPIKIQQRALQIAFKNAIKRAGLNESKPNLHFHSLRHGFGSQLARKGMPIHHIRTLMGHSNISTTNVYLELNPNEAIKRYEELF